MTDKSDEGPVIAALREATEVLEILRRGHGTDVSAACYPALNNCRGVLENIDKMENEERRLGALPFSHDIMERFFRPNIWQPNDIAEPGRWVCMGGRGPRSAYGGTPDEALEAWKKLTESQK